MTKKEIIKLLDKEVGLFNETENENSLGELYVSESEFKEFELVLNELKKARDGVANFKKLLRKIIDSDERFLVLKESGLQLKDKVIHLQQPLIILGDQVLIANNVMFDCKDNHDR